MKPENELLAEEVAFVNTCEKMAEVLGGLDRGRHQFEVCVYDGSGDQIAAMGPIRKIIRKRCAETEPLTLEEFDEIVRTGEAELPQMVHVSEPVAAEMQRLEEELPFEVPAEMKTPKRKGK